ncbi:MAG: hypothetical protein RR400_03080 [Clostridia bacterium]
MFTGVFTAIRNFNGSKLINFDDYSITEFLKGNLGSAEVFFSRFFSYEITLLIGLISYACIFLCPLSFAAIIFRSYLIGLNCTFMIVLCGVGGILASILIIIPCQLAILLAIVFFHLLCIVRAREKRKFGCVCEKQNNIFLNFLIISLVITVLNLVETIFLCLFTTKIILVI